MNNKPGRKARPAGPQAGRRRSQGSYRQPARPPRTAAPGAPPTQTSKAVRKSAQQQPGTAVETERTLASYLRSHLATVLIPHGVIVLVLVAASMLGLLVTSTPMSALAATTSTLWLILNAAPIELGGITLGMVPLLPALGLAWLISTRLHRAVKDRISLVDLLVLSAYTLIVPVLLTLTAAAMLLDAKEVYPVDVPPLGHAVATTALVHAAALVVGMRTKLWKALARYFTVPTWIVDSGLFALRFLTYFAGASLVVWLIFAVAGYSRQAEIFGQYEGIGGILGVLLISLLYLPNTAISTAAVLVGSEFGVGEAQISVFSIHLVPLPPLPLMGAIPPSTAPWAMVLLVVPVMIAAYLCYRELLDWRRAVGAGLFAGLFTVVLTYLASGDLGVYGHAGPRVWLTGLLVLVIVALVGLLAAGIGQWRHNAFAAATADDGASEPEPRPEPDPEPALETEQEADIEESAEPEEETEAEAEPEATTEGLDERVDEGVDEGVEEVDQPETEHSEEAQDAPAATETPEGEADVEGQDEGLKEELDHGDEDGNGEEGDNPQGGSHLFQG